MDKIDKIENDGVVRQGLRVKVKVKEEEKLTNYFSINDIYMIKFK